MNNEIENAISKLNADIGVLEDYLKIRTNYKSDSAFETELIRDLSFTISVLKTQQSDRWIPVTERLPENEMEVEVTVERRYDDKIHTFTCRAVYEDGTVWSEDSIFCWDSFDNMEYNEEKDDYKVPEGWFESVSYVEESHVIDDLVMAWKPISEPWKRDENTYDNN